MAARNLIMGFCSRLAFRHLAPFVASVRTSGFAGDLCLIVQDVSAETIRQLRAHGVIVERAGPSAQPRMAAQSSRIFSYQDFLLREGEGYASVLLVDPATTILQADPFAAPFDAEIVYTAERRRIGDAPTVHEAVVRAYGEAVAHNIRDCTASNATIAAGTRAGVSRYLAAMAHQLAGRTTPMTGAIDQGVHNYVVHMRPLRDAWLDVTDRIAVAADTLVGRNVTITEHGIAVDSTFVPLLARWDADPAVARHVQAWPRLRLDAMPPARPPARPAADAVVAFYLRQRDSGWLADFLKSLRCVSDTVAIHCIGDLDQGDQAILERYHAVGHVADGCDPAMAENIAHIRLSHILDRMTAGQLPRPEQVLLLDSVRAVFPRDPFLNRTIGLSLFCEGPTRIGESDYNRARLAFFQASETSDPALLQNPVVSSMALRGSLAVLREFYRRLFRELLDHPELLQIHKAVQGAVNKLCHHADLGFPVTLHPSGAEVHFDFLHSDLAVDTRFGVRIGGAVPGVVFAEHPETPLMLRVKTDLNLEQA